MAITLLFSSLLRKILKAVGRNCKLNGRVVIVVFTEPDAQTIRIISLRKALPHERKCYEQFLRDELGEI
jgi:uncharacterized DUF497 family protein